MLDGNAVRFTNLEAWWLVDGAWRPISPGEVLVQRRRNEGSGIQAAVPPGAYPSTQGLPVGDRGTEKGATRRLSAGEILIRVSVVQIRPWAPNSAIFDQPGYNHEHSLARRAGV